MASLAELVASPTVSPLLTYVARPRSDPVVERVALIEDLREVERVDEHAIVLLTRGASAEANDYRFDMALRMARNRSVAALVLGAADVGRITPTAAAIADRSGTAILGVEAQTDLAQLALAIGRELAGEGDVALLRAHTALRAIEAHPADGSMTTLVKRAGAALGVPLALVDAEPDAGPYVPVAVNGHVEQWLTAEPQDGDLAMGLDIVLHAVAAEAREALVSAQREEELPIQSRSEVLTELLSVPLQARAPIVQRARDLEMAIDGWHVAVRLDFEELADTQDAELATYRARLDLARAALQGVRAVGGDWHSARDGTAVVLVRTYREDPGNTVAREIVECMDEVLPRLSSRLPATVIRCGVGSLHSGPDGLVSSAAEAKAAANAARVSGRANAAVPFDSVGLRRSLVEWYASDTAQEAVASVLEPLSKLGGARAERLIQTLQVYLDRSRSLSKTGETLNLSRNAVAYRIDQVFSLLEVDPDNPDDLLLLQLACRARELS